MNARQTAFVALALLCSLAVVASAAGVPSLEWSALTSVGGPSTGTSVNMNGTLGQLVVGPSSGSGISVLPENPAPPPPPSYPVYLPLVMRGS